MCQRPVVRILPVRLVSTSIEAVQHAVLAGMGVACLPDFMVQGAVRQGRLRRILDEHMEHAGQFWVLWPSSRQATAKLRALVDHLSLRLFPSGHDR
ncbi:hypothetical protein HU727_018790 [Pseudomonas sp. SWRI153]|uniref:LysR substrate-binding domain-containing protein n=1 Tax=Pseudomonas khorasanensis TaxID=2745508 RepID=A0A923F824_9PSED|nr:LysR substrate-binding domain-containing protein [Pseudomonas khorasanensis]MBV4487637.1 hypothetical protein [Pseudomonas khorasanensis]